MTPISTPFAHNMLAARIGRIRGVFIAPSASDRRAENTIFRGALYLPQAWCDDAQRCEQAGIPEAERRFKTKTTLALEMVAHQRRLGVRFSWVGADGFYGNAPAWPQSHQA